MRSSNDTKSPEARLGELASAQRGVFSRKQAAGTGVSGGMLARRVATGVWVRILPSVFRAASTPGSWQQTLVAACLWAGEGAVVSHRTAARLHGLEGIPRMRRGDPVELTVPFGMRRSTPGVLVHQSRKLEHTDRSTIDGTPVTSFARTLVDISATLDDKALTVALDSGLARHSSIDVPMLRRELRRLKTQGRRVSPGLQGLLAERGPDAIHLDSALERRFSAALRRAGLPKPSEHYDVVENGRRVAEIDFAYPRARLGIELNGAGVHRRLSVWERDQQRLSDLAAAGFRIVHVTWAQLEADETAVVERVKRALDSAGAQTSRAARPG